MCLIRRQAKVWLSKIGEENYVFDCSYTTIRQKSMYYTWDPYVISFLK